MWLPRSPPAHLIGLYDHARLKPIQNYQSQLWLLLHGLVHVRFSLLLLLMTCLRSTNSISNQGHRQVTWLTRWWWHKMDDCMQEKRKGKGWERNLRDTHDSRTATPFKDDHAQTNEKLHLLQQPRGRRHLSSEWTTQSAPTNQKWTHFSPTRINPLLTYHQQGPQRLLETNGYVDNEELLWNRVPLPHFQATGGPDEAVWFLRFCYFAS